MTTKTSKTMGQKLNGEKTVKLRFGSERIKLYKSDWHLINAVTRKGPKHTWYKKWTDALWAFDVKGFGTITITDPKFRKHVERVAEFYNESPRKTVQDFIKHAEDNGVHMHDSPLFKGFGWTIWLEALEDGFADLKRLGKHVGVKFE
jgi:hypothetical protein